MEGGGVGGESPEEKHGVHPTRHHQDDAPGACLLILFLLSPSIHVPCAVRRKSMRPPLHSAAEGSTGDVCCGR